MAIGKNYADHAAEMGGVVPDEPIIFIKPNTTVAGPGDTIVWPAMAPSIDYEAELAIVIGRVCKEAGHVPDAANVHGLWSKIPGLGKGRASICRGVLYRSRPGWSNV